jgi:PASTA domain
MAITHPPLINATPGDPITSEAWNNLIISIKTLYEKQNQSTSQLTISVTDDKDNQVIKNAQITLTSEKMSPIIAGYAGADIKRYIVTDISKGNYKLVVEAENYAVETREIVIPEGNESVDTRIEMTKIVQQKTMANYFGLSLVAADTAIKEAGFLLNRIIDSHGKELTQADIKDAGADIKVINQVPEAGLLHKAGGPVALLVSAKTAVEKRVTVPDLKGLSLNEARNALEDMGLVLGETNTISSK